MEGLARSANSRARVPPSGARTDAREVRTLVREYDVRELELRSRQFAVTSSLTYELWLNRYAVHKAYYLYD